MASELNMSAGRYAKDQVRLVDMTLDLSATGENIDSYETGGFDLPAALDAAIPQGFEGRTIAFKANTSHWLKWNSATRKVQAYTDVNFATEASAAADLTGVTAAPLVVLGY